MGNTKKYNVRYLFTNIVIYLHWITVDSRIIVIVVFSQWCIQARFLPGIYSRDIKWSKYMILYFVDPVEAKGTQRPIHV